MGQKLHKPHLRTLQDARTIRTREGLRQALLRLLELKPLDQITIRDICDEAQIGYTTFFRHHPTKELLLDDVAAEQIRALVALTLPVADAANTRAAAIALFAYVDEHRKLWATLLTGGAEGAMRDEFLRISREIAATRAQPNIWPPADIATILVVSSTIELISWWLRQSTPLSIEQVADIYESVIIAPATSGAMKASSKVVRQTKPRRAVAGRGPRRT